MADPICTFLFAFLVLLTTRAILRDISDILMERVPRAHDIATIQDGLAEVRCMSNTCHPLMNDGSNMAKCESTSSRTQSNCMGLQACHAYALHVMTFSGMNVNCAQAVPFRGRA